MKAFLLSLITIITFSLNAQTGNVGIGTANPDTTLHVIGSIKIEDGTQGASKVLTSNAHGVASWQNFVELDPKILVDSLNIVPRWDGINLVNGTMIDNGTNIGIGVLNPAYKLQISEDINVNGILIGKGLANHNSNLVVGLNALKFNTAGLGNSAFGDQSLENSNANFNTGFGYRTLWKTTTGRQNTAVGNSAIASNLTGSDNVGVGNQTLGKSLESKNTGVGAGAMSELSDGSKNTAVGYQTLSNNINGDNNTAIGNEAGQNNKGSLNVFIGNEAGKNDTTSNKLYIDNSATDDPLIYGDFAMDSVKVNGVLKVSEDAIIAGLTVGNGPNDNENNTVVGKEAFASNISGTGNSAFGSGALYSSKGFNNSSFGHNSLFSLDSGSFNAAFGSLTLQNNVSGDNNVAFGHFSLIESLADNNTAVGTGAMAFSQTGKDNVSIGLGTLLHNQFGNNNTAVGFTAGYQNEGSGNVFLGNAAGYFEEGSDKLYIDNSDTINPLIYGDFALDSLSVNGTLTATKDMIIDGITVGDGSSNSADNTVVGKEAFASNVNGTGNSAFGSMSLHKSDGNNNAAFGYSSMGLNELGEANSAFGSLALSKNVTGSSNVAIGHFTMRNSTADRNTAIGTGAMTFLESGEDNVSVGENALSFNQFGDNNTAVGTRAGYQNGGSGNVFLGFHAGELEMGSNTLYIDNSNTTDPLIYGDFAQDALHINGTINISETLKLAPLTTAPGCGPGDEGLMYFDDSLKKLRVCDGTAWQNLH